MPVTRGAGILMVEPTGHALFLKRGPGGDYPGYWCFPGGTTEGDETAEETAKREAEEETGQLPAGTRQVWTRSISGTTTGVANAAGPAPGDGVDFTTFLQRVKETFEPKLNDEHTGYAWALLGEPPEPLHPGCRVALARFGMDETAVARCIASGQLTSPQRFENMWLFALRITGTGTAYRKKHNEFVYRAPSNYLNEEFLARCNGLPVIFKHPAKNVLDSKEFEDRIVGTIVMPYIAGDEVWGIARIYDDTTASLMGREQLSTSPAVFFRDPSVNSKVELEDGSKVLIEGKPSLLDHLAICEFGVWDKGGEPSGVAADSTGDVTMTDAEKKAAEDARKAEIKAAVDAALLTERQSRADDGGTKLDKVLTCLDSINTRMDAFEAKEKDKETKADKARKDAEEKAEKEAKEKADAEEKEKSEKADKARKDAEEKDKKDKEEKAKADAALAAGNGDLATRLKAVEALVTKPAQTDADYAAMADAQAQADSVFSVHGGSAPRPLNGETLIGYKRRCAVKLKDHSATWKEIGLEAIADSAFEPIYNQIRADAMEAGLNPKGVPADQLREVVQTDSTGRRVTSFVGRPSAWMGAFGSNRRRLIGIKQGAR